VCEHTFVLSRRQEIREMLESGWRTTEIADALGVAASTVGYHVRCIREPAPPERLGETVSIDAGGAVSQVGTRERVHALLRQGVSRAEIARAIGVTKPTVSYHARRLGFDVDTRCARRYDWSTVQDYYDAGHTVSECCAYFGCTRGAWHDAMRRAAIVTRPAAMPLEEMFVRGARRSRGNLKLRLLAAGLKASQCERCGIDGWRGEPLSLALHHINGDRLDNRVENLELLCPNCHSQTDNFAGRRRLDPQSGVGVSPGPRRPTGDPGVQRVSTPETE
jgi:DNA-binding CsgD family transcriptional regulator